MTHDEAVRRAAFEFLDELRLRYGDELPLDVLQKGFEFDGHRVPLIAPQGIFKPAVLDLPLSFWTTPEVEGKKRPYEDDWSDEGIIRYRYRGTDPQHRDNVGMRRAMAAQVPLVWSTYSG
jgi:putative restriction endonuclease